MTATIALDISRLVAEAGRPTPTGILRVELAYAQHLSATRPDRVIFTARNLFGRMSVVGQRQAGRLLGETDRLWSGSPIARSTPRAAYWYSIWLRYALLWRGEWLLRRKMRRGKAPAIYILVSHANLERPAALRRLRRHTGARLVFFIHDLIPLQFPEFETPGWDVRCARRLHAAVELGDAIIVNSHHTRDELLKEVAADRPVPPVAAVPLGITALRAAEAASPAFAGPPYFVIVGTIEPKKNHLLLLNLWRRLRAEMADRTPRLVVIGRRGWENENAVDMLERSRALAGFVEERGSVSDRELAALLDGARALLLPSFTEGFGLPLAEALAAGTPVICSDIAAFREVGGDAPDFLDPLDGPGWRQAILDYLPENSPRRQAQLDRMRRWTPPSWDRHFAEVDKLLATLGGRTISRRPDAGSRRGC